MTAIKVLRWHPLPNSGGPMLGYMDLELPSGLVINGCKLMLAPGGVRWIAPPSVRRVDKDGQSLIGEDGKPRYDQIVDFRDRQARDRFRDLALAALRDAHPEALTP